MESVFTAHTVYNSDWLGSDPVFYNEKTGKVSRNINDVIDFRNLAFHPEGLNNYLNFGYSVFEQTPVQHVKYLRHSSALQINNGALQVSYKEDSAEKNIGKTTVEEDVLHQLQTAIRQWENEVEGEIIIPTSGGYDSRLLNDLVSDKSRIRSFTYGISPDQHLSYEAVYARKIAEILGTRWERIELGDFHHYFDAWDALFGVSTHAHGMYQIEFFTKIKNRVGNNCGLLSGIIGDAWAGSVNIPPIKKPEDVQLLAYSHGMRADVAYSRLQSGEDLLHTYYETHKEKLEDPRFRVIESMRFKIILLCYLFRVPESLDFKPWSPFLDADIALSMLNLPDERRKSRTWQVDYFRKKSLYIEDLHLPCSKKNTLNSYGLARVPLKPLDAGLLAEIIQPRYVEWINKQLTAAPAWRNVLDALVNYPKIGGALRRLGVIDAKRTAYLAYLTLKPLETLIIKRNNA